jgi:hypothetical protein
MVTAFSRAHGIADMPVPPIHQSARASSDKSSIIMSKA